MDDYLTTRQVQDFLKVDRITVYRMLADGRLKGVKIGQQWRFTRREVERLISGETREVDPATLENRPVDSTQALPLHCIQTIQNLFSDVARINALVIDMKGEPLTKDSLPSQPDATAADRQPLWARFTEASQTGQRHFNDADGLRYATEPILDGGRQIGLFVVGPYRLATDGLNEASGDHTPSIPAGRRAEVEAWPAAAVRAIHSVLYERSGFLNRLQQIANLSQLL